MAEEYRPPGAFDDLTWSGVLRGMGKRAGEIADALPREIAANYVDLDRMLQHSTPQGIAAQFIKRALRKEPPPSDPDERPSVSEAPFAFHSSDPAVKAYGFVADPANLIGTGALAKGGAMLATTPLARAAPGISQKALDAAALRLSRAGEARVVEATEDAVARAAALRRQAPGQMELPGLERTEAERATQARRDQLRTSPQTYDEEPAKMDRDAVTAFLQEAKSNPKLFQYGAEPPRNVRGIESMAEHFGDEAGERIYVDQNISPDSDVPYKIEKKHGSGEPMRDRHGDYKYETHEYGDKPKYDPEGNLVTKEIEGHGPPEEADLFYGGPTMDVPKPARGGEIVYDEYGDPQFLKSRGGEPVRDERGRVKEVKNPDYYDQDPDYLELSVSGGGPMRVHGWGSRSPTVDATDIGQGGGGSLLYQTLLADASRSGYNVGAQGLTDDNKLRLLSNTLANYARMGKNPRDVSGTLAGKAPRARGMAEGPELWRAEAEEVKERMRANKIDPNRVRFDGEDFFIDGRTVTPKGILPALGWEPGWENVGQKTVMRMAFFDWLRGAPKDEAAAVAKNWGKLGPLLGIGAGAAALAPTLSDALRQGNQTD